ncbi:MAG: Gfo/Idh/MocA family oxidoreductase [Bryobacteraceae bacterium]|nr:Gfo/Idh/MocA family oxidoreductase [Bryobacteraceae bacterium]MCX7605415.1 Gfo/Idh/MocA family oxidoreductase [Bryobacteraceae bacterium]
MLRVGIIGTGAISHKHAQAYRNIGYRVTVCTDISREAGEKFAAQYGCQYVPTYEEVCSHPEVDFVDVCTFPDFRLQPLEIAAKHGKSVQVQKPISTNLETARKMIEVAREAGIVLGVVSQHRFDDSTIFVKKAIAQGRLGRILQADAYVKWWRSEAYYSRPIKGSWAVEGGGALINQAVHQVDVLNYLTGGVHEVFGYWQLGARHRIESEDVICAVMKYKSGATGVIQSSTAFWPGYPERIEIHGTKGTCIFTGDKLTTWDVENDEGEPAPVEKDVMSGASDPMAIPLTPFERQFLDFGNAVKNRTQPLVSGEEGLKALEIVLGIYESCRSGQPVRLAGA